MFFMNPFLLRQKRLLCKRFIVYEMQFQIKDGPACLCFSLFLKRSIGGGGGGEGMMFRAPVCSTLFVLGNYSVCSR